MTWSGAQGFRTPIKEYNFIVDSMPGGAPMGNVHSERGLTYYEVALSGHMVPQFSPWVSISAIELRREADRLHRVHTRACST
jgi:carboxypeptidase D